MLKRISEEDIDQLEKRFRTNLINSLSGFKSANLVGTIDKAGNTNLAVFSSVIHFGANPPLLGMLSRPNSVDRHTYENIKATGFYTINHIHKDFYTKAHQTAARYPRDISEFEAVGLNPEFRGNIPAPYVAESSIKMGLSLVEEHKIAANDAILLVGQLKELFLSEEILGGDGFIDLEKAESVCISGLDSYHKTERLNRLPYAKP
ncbi:MAG: flavin reductase [Bacteroidia bacterium]|nr:flavin reductase [Bacteroidia bacterium]